MTKIIPFNRGSNSLIRASAGFDDFCSILDVFFNDNRTAAGNLQRNFFRTDVEEKENEYVVEAELPGIKKDEVELVFEDGSLCITVKRSEESNGEDKNFIHRERRVNSSGRRIRLENANFGEAKAKLEDGVLIVSIPKEIKSNESNKIEIG